MSVSSALITGRSVPEARIEEAIQSIAARLGSRPTRHSLDEDPDRFETEKAIFFLIVDDDEYRKHILDYAQKPVRIVLLPWEGNPRLKAEFLLPEKLDEAVALAAPDAETTPQKSLALCNGRAILGGITLGEAEWLRRLPLLQWLLYFLRHLLRLRLRPFRIETAKGSVVETAALIIPVAHERVRSRQRPYFFNPEENLCSRIAAVIYAPLSLLAVFRLRMTRLNPAKKYGTLPPGVGTIKSRRLIVRSPEGPIPLYHDGIREYVAQATIESIEIDAEILLPKEPCVPGDPDKESLRLQNIPIDREVIDFYTRRRLPLVPIAAESRFAELFSTLRDGARADAAYLLLLIVSVLMATVGLFQNSAPTIIGAMILAPLMGPIISFAMGLMRFDGSLIRRSLRTLLLSVSLALALAALLTWLLPFHHLTEQMNLRTHPTLLDLAVALLSGIAAAYGYSDAKVGRSLAGVAIAVALVPPLSVAGIGLGWGSYPIFEGAFLLFLANFAGIILAAGGTFYLLGFTSWRYASSAFAIKLLLIATIIFPLWLSTRTLVEEEKVYRIFDTLKTMKIDGDTVRISLRQIRRSDGTLNADVLVLLPPRFDERSRQRIVELIRKRVGKDLGLIIAYRYRY